MMMGKSQKFSKGHSMGFVPDYRHAIETVGESEVFGSPKHVDSEDSCATTRKCISLNPDNQAKASNPFNIRLQVVQPSRLTSSEKKKVSVRLKGELERVRILQKRLLAKANANGVVAPITMGPSAGKRSQQVVDKAPMVHHSDSPQSTKQAAAPPPAGCINAMVMKQCETLLSRLLGHQHAWVFNSPVDVVKLGIPDYFDIIKTPMDLGTIKRKLSSHAYSTPSEFASDVRLTFNNAMTYNPRGNDVHVMASIMSKFFEARWKPIEKKLSATSEAKPFAASGAKPAAASGAKPFASVVNKNKSEEKVAPPPNKRKRSPLMDDDSLPECTKRKMTQNEKINLSKRLESMVSELPEHIINFLKSYTSNAGETTEDEMEIDIDSLSDDTLFELEKLLDEFSREKQSKYQQKDDPCEVEIKNSRVNNSPMHHEKGNELVEEDVDIGENDIPVVSFPPVEIDKDIMHRSDKNSTSSSSGSDTGSSSSDSDSSSSGSGSDIKAFDDTKDNACSGADVNLGKVSMNGSSQLEQRSHSGPGSAEGDRKQEGENAPSERQISPTRQCRAKLLMGRFADTIIRAKEKTLDQVAKKDPAKLRREKEELEQLQREEKARLQAEAKAIQDARKKAEEKAAAEAAAEAKRQREQEREAARRALQQMEKTVHINEDNLFLKDLEMLGSGPAEHIPSSVGETSPDSPEVLCNFKPGSNPLERLGLFMKHDDDDDDECQPENAVAGEDVEEGEID